MRACHPWPRALSKKTIRLEAIDQGDTAGIQCPAEKVVMLKRGCKVMLLWILTEKLRNGSSGIFLEPAGNELTVDFPEVGKVKIKREAWNKRLETGSIVGSRKQLPLVAMYAITCHKSQGLALPAVVLHSSTEFVPGLTYVACTRVKTFHYLQIVGFDRSQLLKPKEKSVNICNGHCEPAANTSCCRDHLLSEEDFTMVDADCLVGENLETFGGKRSSPRDREIDHELL